MGLVHSKLTPETAIQGDALVAFAVAMFQNERPLQGPIGELDWWLSQAFSRAIRAGVLQGKLGERSYVPVRHGDKSLHFLVLGQGFRSETGRHVENSKHFVSEVVRFRKQFGFQKIGLFKADGVEPRAIESSVDATMEGEFDIWLLT